MDAIDGQTDDSSIKPVSSLRSQFESLSTSRPAPPSTSLTALARPTSNLGHTKEAVPAAPLEVHRPKLPEDTSDALASKRRMPDTLQTKRRPPSPPKSRRPISAIQQSSGRTTPHVNITSPTSPQKPLSLPKDVPSQHGSLTPASLGHDMSHEHRNSHLQIRSRSSGSGNSTPRSSSHQARDIAMSYPPRDSSLKQYKSGKIPKAPPPVNRGAKPIRGKEITSNEAPPKLSMTMQNRKVSPFSTPPSSDESSPSESPPPLPVHSKPKPAHAQSSREPVHQSDGDSALEVPPGLPPRRNVIPSRSQDTLAEIDTKRSALTQGFSNRPTSGVPLQVYNQARPRSFRNSTPPPQRSKGVRIMSQSSRSASVVPRLYNDERTSAIDVPVLNLSEYPDSSQANRKFPFYSDIPRSISTGYESRLFDMCGEYICTTGTTTRVWNLLTGKLLLSITHGDVMKITALCFKPTRKIDQEGTRIWLGTNWGDIHELDVPSKKIVASDSQGVHNKHEIIKMHRCATDIWTLDSDGNLFIWPSDDSGSPTLNRSISNGRIGRRPTASLAIGEELWLAFAKEIKIFKPNGLSESAQSMNLHSISQPGAGDITCGGVLSDMVYFGHSDGKISIYNRGTYEFVEIVAVSIYKITSLVGLGKFLWAGHATGIIFVYDTSTQPWTIKKDWRAHSGPVVSIAADRSSIWRMDRLMVISLGMDNLVNTWDGTLEDDWLENDMQEHNAEYCSFSEMTSLQLTWNTGASKPTDLRYDEENSNFFRELVQAKKSPDIVVFGLQELVDLEDKTLTAKTFFKSRQKDHDGAEHLSSVYRAWRDYLSRCLHDAMPSDDHYSLLHTASLVGLFSCIFVKSSEMGRIRDVQAIEIKTGMGGLHGNKGAIAVRCIMDDSSLCFVNCHLAAGQNKTMDRNNDVAAILESSTLMPPKGAPSGVFVGGGDGSMISDSEICILSGDLNYRIDTMSRDTVISSLKAKNLPKILDRDQLLLSRRKNPGFRLRAFRELPITFYPTYKYDVGTDTYDTSEKRRAPAWCDRILCRGRVEQLDYERHEIRVSDHRPVTASFRLRIKSISRSKQEDCRQRCVQRFVQFKKSLSTDSKLEYLMSVFGLTQKEAQMELAAIREKREL